MGFIHLNNNLKLYQCTLYYFLIVPLPTAIYFSDDPHAVFCSLKNFLYSLRITTYISVTVYLFWEYSATVSVSAPGKQSSCQTAECKYRHIHAYHRSPHRRGEKDGQQDPGCRADHGQNRRRQNNPPEASEDPHGGERREDEKGGDEKRSHQLHGKYDD